MNEYTFPSRRTFLQGAGAASLGVLVSRGAKGVRFREKPVRIGIVGGGFGCAFHWHQHPLCEVAAVSDLRADRRKRLQDVYGCERVYPNLTALLGDERVNAVGVFTEATNHARHVIECLEAGKHVISAVPAVVSLEEARAVRAAQERTGLTYMMAETSWYRYETIVARELYQQGAFGEITYCEAEYYHPDICHERHALSHWDGKRTWRYGYPPMLYATHTTGFLVGVTGERLTRVSCLGTPSEDPAFRDNAYDNRFANEAALFRTSRGNVFRGNVFWQIHADGERAQWLGPEGAFYMPGSGGQPFRFHSKQHGRLETRPDTWRSIPEAMRQDSGHGGSHPHLTHEFVSALVEQRPPAIALDEALAMTVPGIVAHRSARENGATLDVPRI